MASSSRYLAYSATPDDNTMSQQGPSNHSSSTDIQQGPTQERIDAALAELESVLRATQNDPTTLRTLLDLYRINGINVWNPPDDQANHYPSITQRGKGHSLSAGTNNPTASTSYQSSSRPQGDFRGRNRNYQ